MTGEQPDPAPVIAQRPSGSGDLPRYCDGGDARAVEAAWTTISWPVHAHPSLENVASNTNAQNAGFL